MSRANGEEAGGGVAIDVTDVHAAAASVDGERSARALGHLTRALLAIEKGAREEARARRDEDLARRDAAREDEYGTPGDRGHGGDLDALREQLADRLARFRLQYDKEVADGELDAAGGAERT